MAPVISTQRVGLIVKAITTSLSQKGVEFDPFKAGIVQPLP